MEILLKKIAFVNILIIFLFLAYATSDFLIYIKINFTGIMHVESHKPFNGWEKYLPRLRESNRTREWHEKFDDMLPF